MRITLAVLQALQGNKFLQGSLRRSVEASVSRNADHSYYYTRAVLQGPFPLGEPAIATSAKFSYYYARYVLKEPFPLGEEAIAMKAEVAIMYARYVLHGRFELGEPQIARLINYKRDYEKEFGVKL